MKWIINFTMLIGFFATIFGLVLGGLNPWTSPAEAVRMNVETAHQETLYKFEERLSEAKTDAEVQAVQREQKLLDAQYENRIQALNQDLEHQDIAFKTWMEIISYVGGALAIASILWVGSKALINVRADQAYKKPTQTSIPRMEKVVHPVLEPETYDSLKVLHDMRFAERLQEITEKHEANDIIAHMSAIANPTRITKNEYSNLPLV